GFRITIVVGGPELYRNDRRQQFVFANHRRIQDYSLLQALEYGVQGWFPSSVHPVGAVHIEIDPALADFNIHPAKREARFLDPGALHHAITTALRNFLRNTPPRAAATGRPLFSEAPSGAGVPGGGRAWAPDTARTPDAAWAPGSTRTPGSAWATDAGDAARRLAMEALLDRHPDFAPLPGRASPGAETGAYGAGEAYGPGGAYDVAEHAGEYAGRAEYAGDTAGYAGDTGAAAEPGPSYEAAKLRFIGRLFDLFLLVETGDRLLIIDQHAAHERILYDRFLAAPIVKQELLVPIYFDSRDRGEDLFLAAKRDELVKLGIIIEEAGNGRWQITALPEGWRLSDSETVEALRELQNAGENMAERWAATLSCHRAVKDRDYLDGASATALAEAALALPVPRCPHGRPVWVEISRAELYRGVRRA
ncbi:MAG: DNA mismatch repair protein MutL, partial [Treponema sp.]|nr:DNA mismatch repair protein MutL [Treponema sp.]